MDTDMSETLEAENKRLKQELAKKDKTIQSYREQLRLAHEIIETIPED